MSKIGFTYEDPDYYDDDVTWQDMEDQDEDMLNEELIADAD